MRWPNGHEFAFTVVDDTDAATLSNVKPVYELLSRLGMRTTKTAWVFNGEGSSDGAGSTCEEPEYLNWLLSLQKEGFEIAFHNAAPVSSHRQVTTRAVSRFRELFGPGEILFCNHMECDENIYWGDARLSGWRRLVYNLATGGRNRARFRGHVGGDPFFWGDVCQQHVRYVRNFVFDELDALAICPEQPYHDPARPYVNFWFTSSDGGTLKRFLHNFTPARLKQLANSGGLCIAYVHFAYGFAENGEVSPEFQKRLQLLAGLNAWFAPASEILDRLRRGARTNERVISEKRRDRLETKWLLQKLSKGETA